MLQSPPTLLQSAPFFGITDTSPDHVLIPSHDALNRLALFDIATRYQSLPAASKAIFDGLDTVPLELGLRWRILDAKVFTLGSTGDMELFEYGCRLNHSCAPNAKWEWSSKTGNLHVYALIDIPQGGPPVQALRRPAGFPCICTLCSLPISARKTSDANRARYKTVVDHFDRFRSRETHMALNILDEAIDLLGKEGMCHDASPRFADRFRLCIEYGAEASARLWGEAGMLNVETGDESSLARRLRVEPRSLNGWGVSGSVKLRGPPKVTALAASSGKEKAHVAAIMQALSMKESEG